MSTGINIAPSSGLTVGTTAVTSGTNGRVFFQAGGVIQQDANFTFDNTLKRLTLKAVGTAATDIPFAVQNSAGTQNLLRVSGTAITLNGPGGTAFTPCIDLQRNGSSIFFIDEYAAKFNGPAYFSSIVGYGSNAISVSSQSGPAGQAITLYPASSGLSLGYSSTAARLDVKAQGALSTDIAFRVRNSADTASMFYTLGNGTSGVPWGDAYTLQYGGADFGATISKNGQFGTHIRIFQFSGAASTVMSENGFATFGNLALGSNTVSSYRILSSTGLGTEADHILLAQPQNGTKKASMLFNTNYQAGVSYNTARLQVETYVANTVDRTKFNFWATNGGFNIAPTIIGSLTCKSNLLLGTPTEDINDSNTIYIPNGTAPTVALAGGGKLYVEGGALKYIGSAGTITTIGPA